MHLPGETDTSDLISGDARVVQREAHGLAEGSPPIPGILLRPTLVRGGERLVIFCSGRNHSSVFVHDQSTGPAGTDIDSEKRDIPSSVNQARDVTIVPASRRRVQGGRSAILTYP